MAIKIEYNGYHLEFDRFPTPQQIHDAYEALRSRIRERLLGREATSIPRVPEGSTLPLSFAQEWLWILDQLVPGSPVYNLPAAVRLNGDLNIPAFTRSITELVRRHEILRTSFPSIDGKPAQVIAPPAPIALPVVDLSLLREGEREAEALRLAAKEAATAFDLANGPLIRTGLLKLGPQDHVILLTVHHIVSDAWSTGIIIREIATLYEAFSLNRVSPLPELPIQYADYASWQREQLSGDSLDSLISYWKGRMKGAPSLLNLPTDRPRPAAQSFRGARLPFSFSRSLLESLKALARREEVTLFMLLLAAFQTLLYRYTGRDDIVVGSPMAGRSHPDTEPLIGCFINSLALRTDLSGNPRFDGLLTRVRTMTLGAYAHQQLPFEKLVELLQPERNLNHAPIYQVLFNMMNAPMSTIELPGLTMSPLASDIGTAKMDLVIDVWEGDDGLIGLVEYSTALFDSSTIKQLLGHFEALLLSIVNTPEARLNSLEYLTEFEIHKRAAEEAAREAAHRSIFKAARPKAIRIS